MQQADVRQKGLTLVELLVAVAIFAIISAIAVPIYTSYSQRSYDREARADLMACAMALERRAGTDFNYGTVGVGQDVDGFCTPQSTRYTFSVDITTGGAGFTLRAVPDGGAVAGCPTITLNSVGVMSGTPTTGPCS